MIDLHSHILPGLDDGSRTVEDARALARRAAEDGVTAIAATPHVRSDYPTRAEEMERGVSRLREDFLAEGIDVEVLPGGEIDLGMLASLDDDGLRRFTLAQSGRYLLLEFPYTGWPAGLEETVYGLGLRGLLPILAHPERNREVQSKPERLAEAVRMGALVQLTAASLDGRIGRSSQAAANKLLELGLAHVLASDAHTPTSGRRASRRRRKRSRTTTWRASSRSRRRAQSWPGAGPRAAPKARRRRWYILF